MAKPAPFPHHYEVQLAEAQLRAPNRAPIALGPPPQFGGTDHVWSPEDLLMGAVVECLWTTFMAYARRDTLEYRDFSARCAGVLDKGPTGPTFTSITVTVDLKVAPADAERAQRLLETAEKHCIISRALSVPVTLETRVAADASLGA